MGEGDPLAAESYAGRPVARASTSSAAHADGATTHLLRGYQQTLETVDRLPSIVWVPWLRSRRPPQSLFLAPRPRWLVRYFLIFHIERTCASLSRRLYARSALNESSEHEVAERQVLEEYRRSLPTVANRTYLVVAALLVLIVSRWFVSNAVDYTREYAETQRSAGIPNETERRALELVGKLAGTDLTIGGILNVLPSWLAEGGDVFLLGLTAVALATYVVLRPSVAAFRVKRMLLNLYPDAEQTYRVTPMAWSVQRATGIYDLEATAMRNLGTSPPREVPFDLGILALLMAVPLMAGWYGLAISHRKEDIWFFVYVFFAPALLRLYWLTRTARRRSKIGCRVYPPFRVSLPGGNSDSVKVRRPLAVFTLSFYLWLLPLPILQVGHWFVSLISVFLLLPLLAPWWYLCQKDLRHLSVALGRPSRGNPFGSLVAFLASIAILPPILSVVRAVREIRALQRIVGSSRLIPMWTVLAMPVYPIFFAYLQQEMNNLWVRASGIPETSMGSVANG
jgi:hypothetical protein